MELFYSQFLHFFSVLLASNSPTFFGKMSWECFLWLPLTLSSPLSLKLFIGFFFTLLWFEFFFPWVPLHNCTSLFFIESVFAGCICLHASYLCKCHCFVLFRNAVLLLYWSYCLIHLKYSNFFLFFQLPCIDSSANLIMARLNAGSDVCLLNLILRNFLCMSMYVLTCVHALRCKFRHKFKSVFSYVMAVSLSCTPYMYCFQSSQGQGHFPLLFFFSVTST